MNKANYTHDMILRTGVFNVSVLSEDVGMATFQRFGFQSGRDADKFAGCEGLERSGNGLYYLTERRQRRALRQGDPERWTAAPTPCSSPT